MDEARQAWRVAGGQTLKRREWDGEAVLFNDLSGSTHLLSSTAVWLIERLAAAPATKAELAAALGAELAAQALADGAGEPADAIDPDDLTDLLAELGALHLIEPC